MSHWSLVIGHWSLVIGHWSLVISHWSLVMSHWSLVTQDKGQLIYTLSKTKLFVLKTKKRTRVKQVLF
jgi:hypothetical protein